MNPKPLLRLLILGQLFTLAFLVLMPVLIRLLPGLTGKILYALLVAVAVTLAVLLRGALETLE